MQIIYHGRNDDSESTNEDLNYLFLYYKFSSTYSVISYKNWHVGINFLSSLSLH